MGELTLDSVEATRGWGRRLGSVLRAGDLVVLTGPLGAGKTTLTQGIADGMSVRGPITSPTFVLSRVHPSLVGGPDLVHADAYRLTAPDSQDSGSGIDPMSELDALDLDATLEHCVTVVEWGASLVPGLRADYLEVTLSGDGDARRVRARGHGARWSRPEAVETLAALSADGVDDWLPGGTEIPC